MASIPRNSLAGHHVLIRIAQVLLLIIVAVLAYYLLRVGVMALS